MCGILRQESGQIENPYMTAIRTHFVQPGKIEIDANERAVIGKRKDCFFVCTTFDSFLNDLSITEYSSSYLIKNLR